MHDVAVERGKILVAVLDVKQVGAQRNQFAGAAGRAIEAPEQFLPPRLRCKVQIAGAVAGRPRAPGFDRLLQLLLIRSIVARQRLEKRDAAGFIEIVIAVEHLARDRGAGRFAGAGQQRLAQFDQVGGVLPGVRRSGAAQQRAAAFGNRSEQAGEEVVAHETDNPDGRGAGSDQANISHRKAYCAGICDMKELRQINFRRGDRREIRIRGI